MSGCCTPNNFLTFTSESPSSWEVASGAGQSIHPTSLLLCHSIEGGFLSQFLIQSQPCGFVHIK